MKHVEKYLKFSAFIFFLFIGFTSYHQVNADLDYTVNFSDQRIDGLSANSVYIIGCNLDDNTVGFQADHNVSGTQSNWLFSERIPASTYPNYQFRIYISTTDNISTLSTACTTTDLSYPYAETIRSNGTIWTDETGNDSSTRIIEILPYEGQVTGTSTTLSLQYLVNSADVPALGSFQVTWSYQRQPTGFPHYPLDSEPVTVFDSIVSTSTVVVLNEGNYIVEAVLEKCYILGTLCFVQDSVFHQFVVVQGTLVGTVFQAGITFLDPLITDPTATSTWENFLNIPLLLKTKAPFSFGYEMYTIFTGISSSSTPQNIGDITLSFSGSTTPAFASSTFANITLFSTSTTVEYIPAPLLAVIRLLMIAVIWAGAGMHVYHMAVKQTMRDTN